VPPRHHRRSVVQSQPCPPGRPPRPRPSAEVHAIPEHRRHPARRPALVGGWLLFAAIGIGAGTWALAPRPVAAPAAALEPPRFVDEAASAGLVHAYQGEYPYVVGGGVAAFDCDGDELTDLYLAGGTAPASLLRNVSEAGGELRFEAIHDPVTDLTTVTGAYPLDIDADGHVDLAVLRLGKSVILRGLGDCRFERADEALGIQTPDAFTVGFSATWEGAATRPTLAFGQYLTVETIDEAGPDCDASTLVRPAADGVGWAPAITLEPGYCALSMLFSDWDRSGRRDLRVSNDRHFYRGGEEQLWRMAPGAAPRLYTREEGWAPVHVWGMGIASLDLTADGRPEVYLTSQGDNKLQTLVDGATGPAYQDIALRRNVTVHRPYTGDDGKQSTAWHPEFADVNNDGYVDLFVSKGNVGTQQDYAMRDPSNLLIGQPDGTFLEGAVEAGIVRFDLGRGAALVDFNRDGLPDLVQLSRYTNVQLWRNVGAGDPAASPPRSIAMGHWLAVDVGQAGPNRDAIGAWLAVRFGDRTYEREITVGGGHAGGQLGWMHVGLGAATQAEVRVTWPDGEVGPWIAVDADRFVRLDREAGAAATVVP
jgi:enediyne biosynthesis protein E4